jgi:hypothetical protein
VSAIRIATKAVVSAHSVTGAVVVQATEAKEETKYGTASKTSID